MGSVHPELREYRLKVFATMTADSAKTFGNPTSLGPLGRGVDGVHLRYGNSEPHHFADDRGPACPRLAKQNEMALFLSERGLLPGRRRRRSARRLLAWGSPLVQGGPPRLHKNPKSHGDVQRLFGPSQRNAHSAEISVRKSKSFRAQAQLL